jgi:hypothetical protein
MQNDRTKVMETPPPVVMNVLGLHQEDLIYDLMDCYEPFFIYGHSWQNLKLNCECKHLTTLVLLAPSRSRI